MATEDRDKDAEVGDKPARQGAPSGPLVFDIELLSIKP